MKIFKNPLAIFCFGWGIVFFLLGCFFSHFYFFPIAMLPLTIYEFFRTEGTKNTKPLSFLFCLVLIFQFLHTAKIYPFPFNLDFLISLLPVPIPVNLDKFIFLSTLVLIVFSLLLIKYTWGTVTKFFAILLLAGSLIEALVFLPEIKMMIKTPQGQELFEGSKEEIKDNLYYRLRRELF